MIGWREIEMERMKGMEGVGLGKRGRWSMEREGK